MLSATCHSVVLNAWFVELFFLDATMKTKALKHAMAKASAKCVMVKASLNHIALEIEALKARNGRRVPYGSVLQIVEEKKTDFLWLTVDKVNYHLRKFNKDGATTTTTMTMAASTSLAFLGLSSLTGEEMSQGDSTYDPNASMSDKSSSSFFTTTGQSTMIEKATGRCPKGSTAANSAE